MKRMVSWFRDMTRKDNIEGDMFYKGSCYIFHINGEDIPAMVLKSDKEGIQYVSVLDYGSKDLDVSYQGYIAHSDKWGCTILPPNHKTAIRLANVHNKREAIL